MNKNIVLYGNIILLLLLSILSTNELAYSKREDDDINRDESKESAAVAISITATILVLLNIVRTNLMSNMEKYNVYYYGILSLLVIIYGYIKLSYYTFFNYIMNLLLGLIFVVGLAMFFQLFSNYFKSLRGITSFVVYLIFYIPCLFIQFAKYLLNEFKSTHSIVLVLFIFELVLILSYLYLPDLVQSIYVKDGNAILDSYVYLNDENIYGLNDIIYKNDLQTSVFEKEDSETIRQNYSISMWVYLNNYSVSMAGYNKETNIFDYGNGKPKITFKNNEKNTEETNQIDSYRIYFTDKTDNDNGEPTYQDIELPSQKWNNLVFNYSSQKVDLFVNGKIERTYTFKNNHPSYNTSDLITVGSEVGLSGAIGNIRYYDKELSQRDIVNIYNSLMKKDPPVNNL